jgi:ABC-type lipoprotein release transport system permease subunit
VGAVGLLARSEIRRHWRSVVVLTLLVGIVGAIVLATVAGARRSDAALGRFIGYSRASSLEINVRNPTPAQLSAFGRDPGVADFAVLHAYGLNPIGRPNLAVAAAVDEKLGTVVDRARLVAGRRANPAVADEITIGEGLAAQAHLGLGGHLDATSVTPPQLEAVIAGREPGPPAGPRLHLRIVGIVRRPLDLGDRAASGGVVVLTPAFDRAYDNRIGRWDTVLRVQTRHGAADVRSVTAAARRLWGRSQFFTLQDVTSESHGAAGAIDVITVALWIFAGLAALAGAVAIAIVLSREIEQVSVDQSTLRSLGLTRRQLLAMSAPRALLIAGGGLLLATLGAVAASPLFPFGIARRADVDAGVHFDWPVLALGALGVAAFVVLVAFFAAVRATRPVSIESARGARRRGPSIVEMAGGIGLRPPVTNGLRMALHPGNGETAVPVRSAFLGAVFGVAGVVAVLVFAASLGHIVATPRLYGWTWDFKAPDDSFNTPCGPADFGLAAVPGVTDVAAVCYQDMQIDGRPVTGWGFTDVRGTIDPEVVAGRAPRGPAEIALGSVTLDALHKHVGDTVQAAGPNATHDYRVVGRIVLPQLQDGDFQALADGAAFSGEGYAAVLDPDNSTRYLLGRFAPGADRSAVVRRIDAIPQLNPTTGPAAGFQGDQGVAGPKLPPELDRLRQIDWFPLTLSALLAVLATIAVGHALLAGAQRRRRELALLKTLGFDRRQVRATVACQAMTLATVGLIVGIPAGLLIGSLVWRFVANGLGISTAAFVPALGFVLTVPAALAVVNLIGFFPGRAAARTRPAVALASE